MQKDLCLEKSLIVQKLIRCLVAENLSLPHSVENSVLLNLFYIPAWYNVWISVGVNMRL